MAAHKERNFLMGRCHQHPVCKSTSTPTSAQHGIPLMSGIRFVDDCFTQYIYLRHSTADLARARALAEHFRIHAFPPACVLEVEPAAPAHIVCGCRFTLGQHGLAPTCHLQSKNIAADPGCMESMGRTIHTLQDATAYHPNKRIHHSRLIAPLKRALHYCHPPYMAAYGLLHSIAEIMLAGYSMPTILTVLEDILAHHTLT